MDYDFSEEERLSLVMVTIWCFKLVPLFRKLLSITRHFEVFSCLGSVHRVVSLRCSSHNTYWTPNQTFIPASCGMYHLLAAPAPTVLPSGTFRLAGHWGTAYNVSGCKYFMPQKTDVNERKASQPLGWAHNSNRPKVHYRDPPTWERCPSEFLTSINNCSCSWGITWLVLSHAHSSCNFKKFTTS